MNQKSDALAALVSDIRVCRECAPSLPHDPRPVLRVSQTARICIAGQAPGARVHASGVPFDDPSGDRLRQWMGIDRDTFYDESKFAIVPMGFCFPGLDAKGSDLPPRSECAPLWRARVFETIGAVELTLVIGQYAQAWHLGARRRKNLTETVRNWREYGPDLLPLPHPSWRNSGWLKRNPWFQEEIVPELQTQVRLLTQ